MDKLSSESVLGSNRSPADDEDEMDDTSYEKSRGFW